MRAPRIFVAILLIAILVSAPLLSARSASDVAARRQCRYGALG